MPSSPRVRNPDPEGIEVAAATLEAGGLVAFPTETVYGLGADAFAPDAIRRVFSVKGRPQDNPLIVHLADASELARVAVAVTPLAVSLANRFLPGPLTLVLESRADVPSVTTGGLSTVAVRVPDHPVATALLERVNCPVAAPSANRSGRPSPTTAAHVLADLGQLVDLILDGGSCAIGVESTVVDARGSRPVVLREGSVTREMLDLSPASDDLTDGLRAASPGTRYRHYAPSCRVVLAPAGGAAALAAAFRDGGERSGLIASEPAPEGVVEVARFSDVVDLAKHLYAGLRAAEASGVDVVVIEQVPAAGVGRAVMDRLHRAADPAAV